MNSSTFQGRFFEQSRKFFCRQCGGYPGGICMYFHARKVTHPYGFIDSEIITNQIFLIIVYIDDQMKTRSFYTGVIQEIAVLAVGEWIGDIIHTDFLVPCLLYTSPSPRDGLLSRMPSSA